MNESDGAVVPTVEPVDRRSWLGSPFVLSVLPMLLVDTALCIVAANPAAQRLFGTERLPGRSVTDFQCPDLPSQTAGPSAPWFAPSGDANLGGETRRTRLTVSGSELSVEVTVAALDAPDGERHSLVQMRDLTPPVRDRDLRPGLAARRQRDLLERLAGIETRDRSMLADSIHDEPIQRMVAALLRLDNLALQVDEPVGAEMDRIAVQLEMSIDWLRDLILVNLSSSELRSSGLEPALTALAGRIFAGTPTVFSVTSSPPAPLTVSGREATYRILREGLLNVRNHARATGVTLAVEEQVDGIRFVLADNGVGTRSLDSGPGHFGIATMRARAEAEGGVLSIKSSPGTGTVVELVLSLVALRRTGTAPSNGRVAPDQLTDSVAGR